MLIGVVSVLVTVGCVAGLMYSYVIRPRLEARQGRRFPSGLSVAALRPSWYPFASAEERAGWLAEWQAIRPALLDLLSEEQKKALETGKEFKYEFDFAALPEAVRAAIQHGVESHPNTAGRRILSGCIQYLSQRGETGRGRRIHVQSDLTLEGTQGRHWFGWREE